MSKSSLGTDELYLKLIEQGYTFDEIATMNPVRQTLLFRGSKIKRFETQANYDAYIASKR